MKKKKIKYIKPFFIIIIGLCSYGCSFSTKSKDNIEKAEKKYAKAEILKEPTEVKNEGEWIYSEEFEIEYPEQPLEPGYQVEIPNGIELPDDNLLKELSIYTYHYALPYDIYAKGVDVETQKNKKYKKVFDKEQKKMASNMAKMLLDTYFLSGKNWKEAEIVTSELSGTKRCTYQIQEQEKNQFSYSWDTLYGKVAGYNLICEPGIVPVPEPENGDWDQAFQEFSLSILNSLEAGLWDGQTCHMVLNYKKEVTENNGCYQYVVELDGIKGTGHQTIGWDFNCYFPPVNFRYQNGSLVFMATSQMPLIIDKKEKLESKFKNMEEAFDALKKGVADYLSTQKNSYFGVKFDNKVTVEYTYNTAENLCIPILSADLIWGEYSFIFGKTWMWESPGTDYGCFIRLDTGEVVMSNVHSISEDYNIYELVE